MYSIPSIQITFFVENYTSLNKCFIIKISFKTNLSNNIFLKSSEIFLFCKFFLLNKIILVLTKKNFLTYCEKSLFKQQYKCKLTNLFISRFKWEKFKLYQKLIFKKSLFLM